MANLAAAADLENPEPGKKFSISGKVEVETAELVKAKSSKGGGAVPSGGVTMNHIWYGHTIGTLNLLSNPVECFTVRSSFEFRQYMTMYPNIQDLDQAYLRDGFFGQTYWNGFYIREFQGIYSFLKSQTMALELALGYMPYKYNPEVRDMGEFLFRSGTYPLFLINEFNRPFARLTGLRLGFTYTGGAVEAHFDALAQLEREIRPFNDVSLGAVAGVNLLKMVEIGGGVDFAHCIPLDSRLTTKENTDPTTFPFMDEDRYLTYNSDSTVVDTGYYTFSGTKLMARATIDLTELCGGVVSLFSDNDRASIVNEMRKVTGESGGKIYGEYAVIGLKNYPVSANPSYNPLGYKKVAERSPYVVGFNAPTHPFMTYGLYPELAVILFEKSSLHRFLLGDIIESKLSHHLVFGLIPAVITFGGWQLDKQLGLNMNWNKLIGLDEISFELERWPSYYPDSYFNTIILGGPIPAARNFNSVYDSTVYTPRWLWSLYLKKRMSEHIAVVCQMGRNHQRWEFHPAAGTFFDADAAFVRRDEWGWHLSAVFSF